MATVEGDSDPSLIVSSAPFGWRHIVVERRFFRRNRTIDVPGGYPEHRIMMWDSAVACTLTIAGTVHRLDGFVRPIVLVPAFSDFHAAPKTPVVFTKLMISPSFVRAMAEEAFGAVDCELKPTSLDEDSDLRALGHFLIDGVTGKQPIDDAMVAVLTRELALHLASSYSEGAPPRRDLAGRIPSTKLVKLLDYIGRHLHEPLDVPRLAREAGLSTAHFSRAFRMSTGRPPHAYVLARRIAKAAHLLLNSSESIDRISARCGFHDQAHLTRAFKRDRGLTPNAYRRSRGANLSSRE